MTKKAVELKVLILDMAIRNYYQFYFILLRAKPAITFIEELGLYIYIYIYEESTSYTWWKIILSTSMLITC